MEEGQFWIWTKRKRSSLSPYNNNNPLSSPTHHHHHKFVSYGDSWEEQAFAEDERLGGCVWPPRSYSCSFCSREFRSAQALGGHMNVHRRDRARLKQPPSPQHSKQDDLDHQSSLMPHSNANPNSDILLASDHQANKLAPPSSSIQENYSSPPYDSSCISWSNFAQQRLYSRKLDLIIGTDDCNNKEEEADIMRRKRRRIITDDSSSSIPLISSRSSIAVDHIKSQMLELISPSSIEELDLELRLGHSPPKAKIVNDRLLRQQKASFWLQQNLRKLIAEINEFSAGFDLY